MIRNVMNESQTSELLKSVQQVFKLAMGNDINVDIDTEKEMVLEWDSLNHLNLVVELENSFDLGLSMEEIEELNSVRGIIDLINSRKSING
ncbi:MAG TPA: acyl carrier protein [Chitinophagaceae bacterium]|nr:acyl carrier protein [Chitinophagaceae bacterium]HUM65005.1 acyl carrier protein [Chitinophagaceae bacterium]